MRLFNDMVSAVLMCDKPVVCRVNGMRIAGGQEIGMACDFSLAQDLPSSARPGPAPRVGARRRQHGLPAALRGRRGGHGELHAVRALERPQGPPARPADARCPGLKLDGGFVPNPLVITDRWLEEGQVVHGEFKAGAEREAGKQLLARGEVDLSLLDREVAALVYSWPTPSPAACLRLSRASASTSSSTGTATRRPAAPGWAST